MGSIITLGIEKFELDWGKNGLARDYSSLYQQSDVKLETYYYVDNYVEKKEALSAPLSKIKKRLELLGYNLKKVKSDYRLAAEYFFNITSITAPLTFEKFFKILKTFDVTTAEIDENDEYSGDHSFGAYFTNCIVKKLKIKGSSEWSRFIGQFYENLDPLITIRLLAENSKNLRKHIIWRYHDVLDGGWIEKEDVFRQPEDSQKFLIVTEGTTDLFVIKRALELFHADIIDFFNFIDMQENYPFTGCSNLFKFLQGLAKVHPINNVLAVFDNDTAGNEQYNLCKNLKLPKNIKTIKLPELLEFRKFKTIGPTGYKQDNINGKAVSIECFLDLNYKVKSTPVIRWSNYNKAMGQYQGNLEEKENYVRIFKKMHSRSKYNFANLQKLCDYIIWHCSNMNYTANNRLDDRPGIPPDCF